MAGIHGEKFRCACLSVCIDNLNLILDFEMTYDGNAAMRVGGCSSFGDGQNEIDMRKKMCRASKQIYYELPIG